MSVSDDIRILASEGLTTAEIARRLGIRYQHAYNVLKASGKLASGQKSAATKSGAKNAASVGSKPQLSVKDLLASGFVLASRWVLSGAGELVLDQALPKEVGVYAFAKRGVVMYVGVATMGLAKRLYFYGKPGVTQRTSQRLNAIIKAELMSVPCMEIYTAAPSDLEWNGMPVHGSAGLELGLIKKYSLPWNMRSAG